MWEVKLLLQMTWFPVCAVDSSNDYSGNDDDDDSDGDEY